MATIQEITQARLSRYNIELSEVEIVGKLIDQGLIPTDAYTATASKHIDMVFVSVIPELLLAPDITEGGYSQKYDKAAIMAYYSLLCSQLGIPNKLNPQPKIRNKSHLW